MLVGDLSRDIALAFRNITRSPGFAVVVILTLAIGIGANTAIFSVVNALLFKSVAVGSPDELTRIRPGESLMSWPNFEDIRESNEVFSDVAAHRNFLAVLSSGDTSVRLVGEYASANFFSVLQSAAALGRTFSEADSRRDVVVIADHVWRARFGASPAIIGRVLTLAGRPYEVIGVMPPRFRGVAPPGLLFDFWLPVDENFAGATLRNRNFAQFEIIGRLKPGVDREQALAAMKVTAERMIAAYPDIRPSFREMEVLRVDGIDAFRGMSSVLVPILAFLGLMTIVSVLVLVIGCANIAGLLIARSVARRREIGVRLALGAGRGRLVRQFLAECLVLAFFGGGAGILVTVWLLSGANALVSRLPVPVGFDLRLDFRVLLYTLAVSICTAILFGTVPAWRAAAFDIVSTLKEDGRAGGRQRMREILVIGQIAACCLLLVWSGLFLRSLLYTGDVNPGFDPTGVLLANVEVSVGAGSTMDRDAVGEMLLELQQRVEESTAVQSAGAALVVPLALLGREDFSVWMEGQGRESPGVRVVANRLSPGWFETLRIPLLAGRDFSWNDRPGSPRVVIVNESLARQLWNGDAVGKRLLVPGGDHPQAAEVVGVVRDSKYLTLGETTRPTVYLPFRQMPLESMTLHVRTADMKAAADVIHREVRRLAPSAPVDIYPMTQAVRAAMLPARVGAVATGAFGVVAMLLAAIGIYGLMSFMVAMRTREIAIRKAIGAQWHHIIRLVVGGTASLAIIGAAIGVVVGVLGGFVLRVFLVGVSPADPLTLLIVVALTIFAALAAGIVPAVRALRVDPAGLRE